MSLLLWYLKSHCFLSFFCHLKVSWFQNVFLASSILSKNKRKKKNQLYYYGILSQIVFVHFLGELKTPKRHLEINWPLLARLTAILCIIYSWIHNKISPTKKNKPFLIPNPFYWSKNVVGRNFWLYTYISIFCYPRLVEYNILFDRSLIYSWVIFALPLK